MTPRSRRIARTLAGVLLAPVLALAVAAVLTPLPAELSGHAPASDSVRFTDRDGALLREVRADDATRARWIALDEVGDLPQKALLAAEDARFYEHPGVDPVAVARAAGSDLAHARVVSGASTVSMQVARLVRPHPRTLRGKLGEMALALRLEASLTKRQVLEEYVNRAPFGAQLRGLDAASRYYFDKPPRELSLAEAATLAAIPRGPHVYSLTKHPERVLRRRDRILDRMLASRWITREEHDRAGEEPLALHLAGASFGAPHLVQALHAQTRGAQEVTTTIARALQREAETSAMTTIRPLEKRHVTAASVVVLDNASGEVLAYVGSPDFADVAHGGQNDGVRARRQPGSTLKPFVYGLAMERLGFTAATLLPDVELRLAVSGGVYAPANYDERFHGPVRLRDALGNSLNVPAVWAAAEIGEGPLLDRLRDVGFASLAETPEFYGPALALGDGEVTLLELANAYATLARGGVAKDVTFVRAVRARGSDAAVRPQATVAERRIMPRQVAAVITDILEDKNARVASFGERSVLELPFAVAAKTGTSKGFRDNWTVGFTHEVTVAVWVGNFDGSAMEGVSGITGAAPLFRAVMLAAMRGRAPLPLGVAPDDEDLARAYVCPLSGGAPGPACGHAVHEWVPRGKPLAACTMHEHIAIDRRNGLRAGSHCDPRHVEWRTYERFEGRFAAWAHDAHRELPPVAYSPSCPADAATAAASGQALRIGYPHDGARFMIDPDRPRAQQTIAVRVEAPSDGAASHVLLRIDGQIAANVPSPYVVRWALAPGEHVLAAEAPALAGSDTVRIHVE